MRLPRLNRRRAAVGYALFLIARRVARRRIRRRVRAISAPALGRRGRLRVRGPA